MRVEEESEKDPKQRKREFLFVLKPYAEQLIEEDDSLDPLEMARVMRGAFPTLITPKILSQVWSLVDVTDPDRAINWTQIYADAGKWRPVSYYNGEAYCQAATFILEQYAGGRTLPQVLPILELGLCAVPKGFEDGEAGSLVRFYMGWDPDHVLDLCETFFSLDELLDEKDPVQAARWVIFALSDARTPSGVFFREHAESASRGPYPYPPGWPFRATDFPDDAEFYRGSGALLLKTRQPDGKEKLINYLGGKITEVNMKMFGIDGYQRIDFREFWETAAISSGRGWWGMPRTS